MPPDTYHHGNLRAELLKGADAFIRERGVAALSLRVLAAQLGVSHAAPTHHFGTRSGLLTALAVEGFDLLAEGLRVTRESSSQASELGAVYVTFAQEHPAHFAVMFDPDTLLPDDEALTLARRRALHEITRGIEDVADPTERADLSAAVLAGWAMMHGLVELNRGQVLSEANLPLDTRDLPQLSRRIASMLYGSPTPGPSHLAG